MMRIAVTAASGQLGGEIIKAAIELVGRENVIGLARTPSKAAHLGVEIRDGDYNNRDELTSSVREVDCLLLVSGLDAPAKRIEQHRNVIQAAIAAGVTKLVYTSVQGADEGNAFSPIIQSNRQTEEDVRNSGLDWVIGRNGIYIEPDPCSVRCRGIHRSRTAFALCGSIVACGSLTCPRRTVMSGHQWFLSLGADNAFRQSILVPVYSKHSNPFFAAGCCEGGEHSRAQFTGA
jgi:NAD(P)H dehydrogenase (quinone)